MSIPKGWKFISNEDGNEYHDDEERVYQLVERGPDVWVVVAKLKTDGKYYVVPALMTKPTDDRKGPYDTLGHACKVAETICMLNAVPKDWTLD